MPTFRTKSDTSTSTAASVSLAPGVATQDGDVMIAVVNVRGPASTQNAITPPAGWTQIDFTWDSGTPTVNAGAYWKLAASEGSSYTWTFNSSEESVASILSYSDTHTTTPIHNHAIGVQDTSSTTRTTPSITVSLSGCLLVSYFCDRSGSTWTGPDTERSEIKVPPGPSASQVVCDSGTAVSTGTLSRSATASAGSSVAVQGIIALRAPVTTTSSPPPPHPYRHNLLIR